MPKEKKEEVKKPPSIWEKINEKIKAGIPLTVEDIEPIQYFIRKGEEILDMMTDWIMEHRVLLERHKEKLENVKARLLAEVI